MDQAARPVSGSMHLTQKDAKCKDISLLRQKHRAACQLLAMLSDAMI
jgi:hypothetical protein